MFSLVVPFVSLTIAACAFAPKEETARFESTLDFEESVKLVERLVDDCWERPRSPWGKDAIYGVTRRRASSFTVTLGRDNTDISFMPFARIIVVSEAPDEVFVIVEEGDVFLLKKWSVDRNVEEWLGGSRDCGNQ